MQGIQTVRKQAKNIRKEFQSLDNELKQLARDIHWRRIEKLERQRHWFQGNVWLSFWGAIIFGFVAETVMRPVVSIVLSIFWRIVTEAYAVTALGVIAGGLLGYYSRDEGKETERKRACQKLRLEKIKLFHEKRDVHFYKKLRVLEEVALSGKWEGEVDLIINPSVGKQLEENVGYGKEITPCLFSDKVERQGDLEEKTRENYVLATISHIRKSEKAFRWERVDLNRVGLTAIHLKNLIKSGLGDFEIRELILSYNPLQKAGLQVLHDAIVLEDKFRNLKKLSLKRTALEPECLALIQAIVTHVNLETLDVSRNVSEHDGLFCDFSRSEAFLKEINHSMVSLKKLRLNLNNISHTVASCLAETIKKALLLKHIDLRGNILFLDNNSQQSFYRSIKENISLDKIHLFDEKISSAELDKHKALFKTVRSRGDSQGDALIDLLNFRLKGQEIPERSELSKFLKGTYFSWDTIKKMCEEIEKARASSLHEKGKPVRREEFVSYIKGGVLPLFGTS